jgi:transposase
MKPSDRTDTLAACGEHATMYVAFELGKAKWKLGLVVPGSNKLSRYTVDGGDVGAVQDLIDKAKTKAQRRGHGPVRLVSCYEAG